MLHLLHIVAKAHPKAKIESGLMIFGFTLRQHNGHCYDSGNLLKHFCRKKRMMLDPAAHRSDRRGTVLICMSMIPFTRDETNTRPTRMCVPFWFLKMRALVRVCVVWLFETTPV